MKSLKIISILNQNLLQKSNIAQLQTRDNLLRNLLKMHHLHGTGENIMVYLLLKIKENVEAAGHSLLLEA